MSALEPATVTINYAVWHEIQRELATLRQLRETIAEEVDKAFEDAKKAPLIRHDDQVVYWVQQAQLSIKNHIWKMDLSYKRSPSEDSAIKEKPKFISESFVPGKKGKW